MAVVKGSFTVTRQRQRKLNIFFLQEWVTFGPMELFMLRPVAEAMAKALSSNGLYAQL